MCNRSNFCFSHSVFKRLVLQTLKNQDLFGKGLNEHKFLLTKPITAVKTTTTSTIAISTTTNTSKFISCFPVGYREISVKISFDLTLVTPVKIPIFMFLLQG